MKPLLCLILAPALLAGASEYQITTNLVTAAPHFRVVGGQLFNTERSVLWKTFEFRVKQIHPRLLVGQMMTNEPVQELLWVAGNGGTPGAHGATTSGYRWRTTGQRRVALQTIAITNGPTGGVTTGDVMKITAMRAGNQFAAGAELWDCGVVNQVQVIRTNRVQYDTASATAGSQK